MISNHILQINNFERFIEAVWEGCENLNKIQLITGRETGHDRFLQDEMLERVANDAMKKHKNLQVEIVYKNNLHDRRITFVLN